MLVESGRLRLRPKNDDEPFHCLQWNSRPKDHDFYYPQKDPSKSVHPEYFEGILREIGYPRPDYRSVTPSFVRRHLDTVRTAEAYSQAQPSRSRVEEQELFERCDPDDFNGETFKKMVIAQANHPKSYADVQELFGKSVTQDFAENHESFVEMIIAQARRKIDKTASIRPDPSSVPLKGSTSVPSVLLQKVSPFSSMKSIQSQGPGDGSNDIVITIFNSESHHKPTKTSTHVQEVSRPLNIGCHDLPRYAHYVTLKQNILAENNKILRYLPFLDDDNSKHEDDMIKELQERFHYVDKTTRKKVLERTALASLLRGFVEEFLVEIGTSTRDVLLYLLTTPKDENCMILEAVNDEEVLKALSIQPKDVAIIHQRDTWCVSDTKLDDTRLAFRREATKWDFCVDSCRNEWDNARRGPKQSASGKRDTAFPIAFSMAALACAAFFQEFGFSIWHIVKKHALARYQQIMDQRQREGFEGRFPDKMKRCRVCHL